MNASFDAHVPEDALEAYAMGKLPEQACAPMEEHLLICPVCRTQLEAMDDYVCVVRAAFSALSNLRTMPAQAHISVRPSGYVSVGH
jgi:anti-sigma factor RsiW